MVFFDMTWKTVWKIKSVRSETYKDFVGRFKHWADGSEYEIVMDVAIVNDGFDQDALTELTDHGILE